MLRIAAAAMLGLWISGSAIATTYSFVGMPYTSASGPYTTAMFITGSFGTASPLPPNLIASDSGPNGTGAITTWSFFDGVNTYTQANSWSYFSVVTDARGNVSGFSISLQSPPPPNAVNDVMIEISVNSTGPFYSVAFNNATCNTIDPFQQNACSGMSTSERGLSTNAYAFAPNFAAAPPTIAKAFGKGIRIGGTTSLTFTLANSELAVPLTGVAFTDTLPAGMLIATPSGLGNTCGGVVTAAAGTNSVSLVGGTIASNSSCTVTVSVIAMVVGSLVNTTGPVTSLESLAGDTATATLAVEAVPQQVPTLRQGALWLVGLLLAVSGAAVARRRRYRSGRQWRS